MASSIESLIARYQLAEENVNRIITDIHIEVISRCCCSKWKSLPAHLGLATIIAEDINRKEVNEEDKRRTFLTTWKEKKGFEATYKTAISALLEIECRSEAESVCQLLKDACAHACAMSLQLPDEQQQDEGQQHQEQPVEASAISNNRSTASDSGILCVHITLAFPIHPDYKHSICNCHNKKGVRSSPFMLTDVHQQMSQHQCIRSGYVAYLVTLTPVHEVWPW